MRRLYVPLLVLALTAAVVVGLSQAGGKEETTAVPLDEALEQLEGAPAPLAALHEQSGRLLGGGEDALRERLAGLRGHPVVINKWASWCGPCRTEFPILSRQATEHGRQVAFLGVDYEDARDAAQEFLAQIPLPYPHYEDPDGRISASLGVPKGAPVTLFVDREGRVVKRRFGEYRSEADLQADIERYAL